MPDRFSGCDTFPAPLFPYGNRVKPDDNNARGASWRHLELTGGEWYDFDPDDEDEYQEVAAAIAKATG